VLPEIRTPTSKRPRELLEKESVLDELVREPDAHLEEAVVQSSELEGQSTVSERRLSDAEARHAEHGDPRSRSLLRGPYGA
jgi:hypothetical protein